MPNIDCIPFFNRPIGRPRIRITPFHPGCTVKFSFIFAHREISLASPWNESEKKEREKKREFGHSYFLFTRLPFSFYLPRRAIHRSIGVPLPCGTKTRANNIANGQYSSPLSQERATRGRRRATFEANLRARLSTEIRSRFVGLCTKIYSFLRRRFLAVLTRSPALEGLMDG